MHLVLIGLMGVGKTTVGVRVAARLGLAFVDSDLHIEATTGRTVKEILAEGGVDALRALEAAALFDALDASDPSVIGCAAGVVLDPVHIARIDAARAADVVRVVWLTGSPAVLAPRTLTRGHRPWLDDDPEATLTRMLDERRPLYEQIADLVVDVTPDGRPGDPEVTAETIATWFAGAVA